MEKYIHKVNYYETDKMGITHHSNYIRWMEEARIFFFDQIGFDDSIEINLKVAEFKGVKLVVEYEMVNAKTHEVVLIGKSKHCFVDEYNKPIILKRKFPELDAKLKELSEMK